MKDYLNQLLEFSDKIEGINAMFKDETLEENYINSLKNSEYGKSKIMLVILTTTYLFAVSFYIYFSNWKLDRTTYFMIAGLILEIILAFITHRPYLNVKLIMTIKYIRVISAYLNNAFVLMFPSNKPILLNDGVYLRNIWSFLIIYNVMYYYSFELNFIFSLILGTANSVFLSYIQFNFNFRPYFLVPEFIINLITQFVSFKTKKEILIQEKKIFLNTHKNERFFKYIENLINVLNTMVISMNLNNEVLFMNNFASDYFNKKFDLSLRVNNILFTDYSSLFNSLVLKTPIDINSSIFKEGRNFNEILSDIQISINNHSMEYFTKIGFFTLPNEVNCYEIYFRKLKFGQVIVEFLINDVTEIKFAEKLNAETKYKQKILDKIAHEFKTPLISITSLIYKINPHQNDFLDEGIKVDLNHINNLSNYTIFLINDIIQYVSNSVNLLISKTQINLREVLNFSFNILKTLIECNEAKVNIIEPKMLFDETIDNLAIVSDENRLKQIILNFVSNSFKFTKSGFIKIEAKCINREVEISVEDSGIGIKEEDYHLIFLENTQLNLDHEYNSKGSGLGLSITKNLANALGHKINFNSKYRKGTKFNLLIKCTSNDYDIIHFKSSPNISKNIFSSKIQIKQNYASFRYNLRSIKNLLRTSNEENDILENFPQKSRNRENYMIYENIREKYKKIYQEKNIDRENKLTVGTNNDNLKLINLLEKDKFIKIKLNENELPSNKLQIESFWLTLGNLTNECSFKIVVIDDYKLVRNSIVYLIKNVLKVLHINNVEIIEGNDGIDLLNIVIKDKNNKIKYIFTDENMEFLNGSQAVRILRKLENDKKIPKYQIISITAFDDSETRNNILNSGVDSILSKPCTKNDISKILSNLIKEFN